VPISITANLSARASVEIREKMSEKECEILTNSLVQCEKSEIRKKERET